MSVGSPPGQPVGRRRLLALGAAAAGWGISRRVVAQSAPSGLRVVVPAVPVPLDPHRALSRIDRLIAGSLFRGLLALDGTGALVPDLAEQWTVSADGLAYTFTLRDQLQWSDGRPLTADDVRTSLLRALDPATAAPFAALLAVIARPAGVPAIAVSDTRTVTVGLARPSAHFLEALAQPIAAVVPTGDGSWAKRESFVGSGPFGIDPASAALRLIANPRFGGVPPKAAAIGFLTADSFEAAAARIRGGAADIACGYDPEPIAGQRILRADQGQTLLCVAVNLKSAQLERREVRHALGMAIDRERIIRSLRLGDAPLAAVPAYAAVPPMAESGPYGHPAPYMPLAMDDRAVIAQVLLSGESIDPSHPIRLTLSVPLGRTIGRIARSLADAWTRLGVQIDIVERSAADHAAVLAQGTFDLALAVSPRRDVTAWPYLSVLGTSSGPELAIGYGEPDFDRHLAEADAASGPAAVDALGAAEDMVTEDQTVLPILAFTPAQAMTAAVTGWQANSRGIHPLRDLGLR